ncbi:helix-turn-helix transcriptional regulator [Spirosoma sp. SC4-14]|uniref:helix-turn-helix domain-containing protein n=1 Tax=Spirosoma sp. SC4-14 TaxID=3128900 RepID=UPI0030D4353E
MTEEEYSNMKTDLESKGCVFFENVEVPKGKVAVAIPFSALKDTPGVVAPILPSISVPELRKMLEQYNISVKPMEIFITGDNKAWMPEDSYLVYFTLPDKEMAMPLKTIFETNIRLFRAYVNVTQKDFGNLLGLSESDIASIESGRDPQQAMTVFSIITLVSMGCNPNWLFLNEGPMLIQK